MTDAEKRVMLLRVPDFGRVTTIKVRNSPRIVIDFKPHLDGSERYLWSFAGKAFESRAQARSVLKRIRQSATEMSHSQAVGRFRGRLSRVGKAGTVIDLFLEAAPTTQSERTGKFLAPRSIDKYRDVLRRAEPFYRGMTLSELTSPRTLRNLKAWFRLPKPKGRGLQSDQEARLAFAALRAVVTWYRVDHPRFDAPDWPSMPTALTAKQENQAERNTTRLTLPQVVRAIDCMPPDHQPLFWVLFYTGCRTSEARGVLGRDWSRPSLTICRSAATKHAGAEIRNTTKTGETGTWKLPEDVCDLIDQHCTGGRFRGDAPLFVDGGGLIHSYDWVRDEWERATTRADIPWVPPYRAFKHTQVSALIDSGLPIEDLINQYRWTSDQMVDHYDDRKDERRSGVVAKLSPMVEKARTNRDSKG